MCEQPCREHPTYGACLRAKRISVGYCRSATGKGDYSAQKRADRELELYRRTRKEGIQPETTRVRDIERARRISDETGKAYGGTSAPG